jgi:hypothetical protein
MGALRGNFGPPHFLPNKPDSRWRIPALSNSKETLEQVNALEAPARFSFE